MNLLEGLWWGRDSVPSGPCPRAVGGDQGPCPTTPCPDAHCFVIGHHAALPLVEQLLAHDIPSLLQRKPVSVQLPGLCWGALTHRGFTLPLHPTAGAKWHQSSQSGSGASVSNQES